MATIKILDGGMATQLSLYVNEKNIESDGHPLWVSRFLLTNPEAIELAQLDYLRAGAEIIHTYTYQASVPGFMKHLNLDEKSSYELIKESVKVAKRAIEKYLKENSNARKVLIAGSIGSYGAYLNDGSEYTGAHIGKVSKETMKNHQRGKVKALIEGGVDLLAFDTIPAFEEAEVLLELLKEYPNQKAWLSFQCKDSQHTASGENYAEVAKKAWELAQGQLIAVGCNCVNPNFVDELFKSVNDGDDQIPLIVYTNSGEKYSSDKGWYGKDQCRPLGEFVENWIKLGARYIGSCCRTNVKDTADIRKAVDKWMMQQK